MGLRRRWLFRPGGSAEGPTPDPVRRKGATGLRPHRFPRPFPRGVPCGRIFAARRRIFAARRFGAHLGRRRAEVGVVALCCPFEPAGPGVVTDSGARASLAALLALPRGGRRTRERPPSPPSPSPCCPPHAALPNKTNPSQHPTRMKWELRGRQSVGARSRTRRASPSMCSVPIVLVLMVLIGLYCAAYRPRTTRHRSNTA